MRSKAEPRFDNESSFTQGIPLLPVSLHKQQTTEIRNESIFDNFRKEGTQFSQSHENVSHANCRRHAIRQNTASYLQEKHLKHGNCL